MKTGLSPQQLAENISRCQSEIIDAFVARTRNEVPAAYGESYSYLQDHLPAVLREMVLFLQHNGSRKDYRESVWLAQMHGTQRSLSASYSVSDLRHEYGLLRELILAQVPPEQEFARETVNLFGQINEMSLSHATEQFIQNAKILPAEDKQKLAENQHRWLEELLNQLPKPLFLLDPKNKTVTFSNKAAVDFLGFSHGKKTPVSEYYGDEIQATDADGRPLTTEDMPSGRVFAGEKLTGEEFIITTAKGTFHFRAYSSHLPEIFDQPASALIMFHDVTALKTAEKSLKQTEIELRQAIQVAKIGFWTLDIKTNKIRVSPLLLAHFGIDAEKFRGTLAEALNHIHPEDVGRVAQAINEAIYHKAIYHIQYRVVHENGAVLWLEARGEVSYNKYDEPERFTGTTIDITDEKNHTSEIEEAKMVAESANAAKSQFLANMSHEIRTPLGAIMGFVSLLKDETLTRKDAVEYMSIIDRNSTQLLRIIDDILDLSKVEAGMMLVECIDFSIVELLADFSSLMGLKAREKGISFFSTAETPLPKIVNSDPTRLRQILINIVGNAIKFTDQGRVELKVSYREGQLEFEVRDTGRGISPEQEKRLFKAFSQADSSTTRKFGGTGLGLVLTRKLAEALGGKFILKSSHLGEGSVFYASIQVGTKNDVEFVSSLGFESIPHRDESTVGLLEGLHILLVEDSPDNQALISVILSRAGAKIDIASDGQSGFNQAIEKSYDVVLMDVQMPIMDGITAVKKLRASGYTKPVIALTAHAMKEERIRCLEAGYSDFLSKPIVRKEMIESLRRNAERGM